MAIKSILRASFAWACLIYAANPASATVILQITGGASGNTSLPGEAIKLAAPSNVTFQNIVFNWFSGTSPNEVPYAFGTLYIIDSSQLGLTGDPLGNNFDSTINPANLAANSTGVVGTATASGGLYTFTGVTLKANTTYFFFEAGTASTGSDDSGLTTSETVSGADSNTANVAHYRAPGGSNPDFVSFLGANYDFRLQGTVVPEPSTLAMLGSGGLTGLAYALRSRNRKKAAA